MYLSEKENIDDLLGRMPEDEREKYARYGHHRIMSAFVNRTFIVYRANGKNKMPEVLARLNVVDFQISPDGAFAIVENMDTGLRETITYVPRRVFDFPVFLALPPVMDVRYDARIENSKINRWVAFAVLAKTRNRADFYSSGNVYLETPNNFKRLYPNVSIVLL